MAQFTWPSAGTVTIGAIGTNGATAPTSSLEVGGIGADGNLHGISTDNSGNVNANIISSALPTGAATSALQTTGNTSLGSIDTKTPSVGQKAMAASSPVVISSDQSTLPVSAASLPLPAGAATETTLAAMSAKLPATLGAKVTSASMAVNIASDQIISITQADLILTGPASQTTGNNILASDSTTPTDATNYRSISIQINSTATGGSIIFEESNDASSWVSAPMAFMSSVGANAPAATFNLASASTFWQGPVNARYIRVRINSTATGGSVQAIAKLSQCPFAPLANIIQQTTASNNATTATQAGTWTVQPGNTANTTAWLVGEVTSGTATLTNVASSATTVSILALNASRKHATFYNDSTQILYLKLGTTASTSSYTVQIPANGYYELPLGKIYTGAIDGIWASANGNLRVTELT